MSRILENYFKEKEGVYISNITSFGMSPRYDLKLHIEFQDDYTEVTWGGKDIIFYGNGVKKNDTDLTTLLKFLGLFDFILGND